MFGYLGLSYFSVIEMDWSWSFILVEMLICIVARFMGTVCLLYMTAMCKHKRQISFKQVLFICYAGLIRGAIAFGLVLKLDNTLVKQENLAVITTTALTLVVSSTLIFGSTMQMVQRVLIPPLSDIQKVKELVGQTKLKALLQN